MGEQGSGKDAKARDTSRDSPFNSGAMQRPPSLRATHAIGLHKIQQLGEAGTRIEGKETDARLRRS